MASSCGSGWRSSRDLSRPRGEGSAPLTAPTGVPPLVALAFVLSGAAGLVYQVAWQRILALHSGVGIYSVAMIVAAFMAGLGLGSRLGGSLSTRVAPRRALALFGLLELGIGAFGAASGWLYYDLVQARSSLYASPGRAALLHLAALVVPTSLMGMTLPLLVRATVRRASGAARSVGLLYGLNVLGASAGALITPWVLVPSFGIRGALSAAALANLGAGLTALAVALSGRRLATSGEGEVVDAPPVAVRDRHAFGLWIALYALSGFCALSLEIVWFRLLDVAVKSTAFTFGTLLAFYLLGSGLGCLAGVPLAERLERPLRAFLLCQCLLLAYAGLSALLLVGLPAELPVYGWFARHWESMREFALGTERDWPTLLRLYVLLPAVLFGPPTWLMGLSFPALQRAVHDAAATSGRKVGVLQAANIAGCVAGSLGIGLLALARLGTPGSLRLLMACGVAFALVGMRLAGSVRTFAALAAALLALAVALPGPGAFWRRFHGATRVEAFFDEDASGVGALVRDKPERWIVFVNGHTHSAVPYGGIHSRLGAAPALVHPAPLDVAIIGLGSGDTAWASACRAETRSLTVFEILGPQPRLLRRLARDQDAPTLRSFLADPRLSVRIADGRVALRQQPTRYDLIEADAQLPNVAYAGNLYSLEFFRECAERLKPGGIMCSWAPTPRVYATFGAVFPHVLRDRTGLLLIGSLTPLPVRTEEWLARLAAPSVQDYLGPRIAADLSGILSELQRLPRRRRVVPGRLNLDLYPRDEFRVPVR
jgi:predicted membrane-bound spermidine synthase